MRKYAGKIIDIIKGMLPSEHQIASFLLAKINFDTLAQSRLWHVDDLLYIGSDYGGWTIPRQLLDSDSICYCVGVGEDITFDLGLINIVGCDVFSFDPTPRAIEHVKKYAKGIDGFHFFEYGLWDKNEQVRFFAPRNPLHVSHSALNLQKTDIFFEAPCKRLSTIMQENKHEHIDLLKLDIEGSEYVVLRSLVLDRLDVKIICVEFDETHHPLDGSYKSRIRQTLRDLRRVGYKIVAIDQQSNYTLVRRDELCFAGCLKNMWL